MDIEVSQTVLPDTVFIVVVVLIPYNMQMKQVLANDKKRALNEGLFLSYLRGLN